MNKLTTLLFFLLCSTIGTAQDVLIKETIKEDGVKEIKYRIKSDRFNSVRVVLSDKNGIITNDTSLVSDLDYGDITIIKNSAIIAKTNGNYDVGYVLNDKGVVRTICIIDKQNGQIKSGYTLTDNLYQRVDISKLNEFKLELQY